METQRLIAALAADGGKTEGFGRRQALALGAAVLAGALVFGLALRPRADLGLVLSEPRLMMKFAVALALALGALPLVARVARPGARLPLAGLWAAPLVLAFALGTEWASLPPEARLSALMGKHNLACPALIGLIGLGPLAVLLTFLRHGAPTRPARAGALAGLAAGGIAASLYALHCTDDSPFFVAAWYAIGVLALTGLGAALGGRLLRW